MLCLRKFSQFFTFLFILQGLSFLPTAYGKDHVIDQKNKEFSVKEIKVKLGDTLTFKNSEDSITHNVYSISPSNSFELKVQKPGEKSTVELKAGSHNVTSPGKEMIVECAIHPNMKLKVTIEK